MKGLFLHVDSFGVAWLLIFRLQRMFLCFCDNFLQKKLYNDCRTSLRIIHQMLFFSKHMAHYTNQHKVLL